MYLCAARRVLFVVVSWFVVCGLFSVCLFVCLFVGFLFFVSCGFCLFPFFVGFLECFVCLIDQRNTDVKTRLTKYNNSTITLCRGCFQPHATRACSVYVY